MLKRQKEAAGRSPEQELQHPEGEIYTNLTLQQTEASLSSPQKKATDPSLAQGDQEEVDYTIIASFQKEDISYATLSLDTSNPEPTYGNMDYFSTHTPSRSQEEHIEYSIIRRT
ncbi:CMRF35-like molecule 1 isoform X2 [Erinaceus europaeus]|nr:CMRF35-like molecule 1 isoform X2 [Erinaceus europaeus]XP_060058686.1 CMRF35-like molecule 1 isoform X2 [Erinaceus europaeus]